MIPVSINCILPSGTQGVQFAATAGDVVREAKRRGLGQEIPTSWFLQDIKD